jgi:hypothetical protein
MTETVQITTTTDEPPRIGMFGRLKAWFNKAELFPCTPLEKRQKEIQGLLYSFSSFCLCNITN